MEQLTLSLEEVPASPSPSPEDERAWAASLALCSSTSELYERFDRRGFSGRTSPEFLTRETMLSPSFSGKFKTSGIAALPGEFLMLSSSEWPSDAAASFLSDALEQGGGAAAVLFESESVRGYSQTSKQKREELARAAGRGSKSGGGERSLSIDYKQTPKVNEEISHTITHEGSGGIHSGVLQSAGDATADATAVTIHDGSRWVVRRLTPMECERLQGFPDGWTDVPYRGKENPPDTPRYKALGNSMAVPVMRWIGERIQMVQEIMDEMEQ